MHRVRYAAAPVGNLRWQAPRLPALNPNAPVTQANAFGAFCPQTYPSVGAGPWPVAGNEDCLYLNVYAPANAQNLPVLVWIHGGGYGLGEGNTDMTSIINANNNGFVVVAINYRVSICASAPQQKPCADMPSTI